MQLIVMVGLDIVYCVTGGKSMQYVWQVSASLLSWCGQRDVGAIPLCFDTANLDPAD